MSDTEGSDSNSTDSDVSDSGGSKYSFTWKIDNFSFCYHKTGEFIKSPIFTVENLGSSMWFMKLYPKGKCTKDKKHISLYLRRCREDPFGKEVNVRVKYKIIDGNEKQVCSKDSGYRKFNNGTQRGYSNICLSKIITNHVPYCKKDTLTIRCTMIFGSMFRKCRARSKVIVHHCSFNLEVPLLDFYINTPSKFFSFSESSQYEMTAVVKDGLVKIEIRQQKENSFSPKFVSGKISLINVNGNNLLSHSSTHMFEPSKDCKVWEFPTFFTKQDLEDNKKEYIKGNSFTLLSEFSASNGMYSTNLKTSSNLRNLLTLQDNLKNMLKEKKHCDLQLQVEDMIFPTHKSILASRSPVFSTMLDQDMVESKSGTVVISDVDGDTMRSFLEFMYTGKVEMKDSGSVTKLLLIADKYQVGPLKEMCSDYLLSSLAVENVCEVLLVADLVAHETLKQFALDYVATNIAVASSTTEWSERIAKNNRLLNEIVVHIAGDFKIIRKK